MKPIAAMLTILGALWPLASAAGLGGVAAGPLSAGSAAVSPCDANGFSITYTTSGGNVTQVTVGGIADPACEGGRLSLTVVDSTGTSIASGGPVTVPTDGDTTDNSLAVAVSPNPAAESPAAVHVSVVGP